MFIKPITSDMRVDVRRDGGGGYVVQGDYKYCSPRYCKSIALCNGEFSDGASGALDIDSNAWLVHDVIFKYKIWEDGTYITRTQCAMVLHDILKSEGYYVRAKTWLVATYLYSLGAY